MKIILSLLLYFLFDYSSNLLQCNADAKVSDMSGTHSFGFDRVFGPDVRQVDVFEEVAKPVVDGKQFLYFFKYNRYIEWI